MTSLNASLRVSLALTGANKPLGHLSGLALALTGASQLLGHILRLTLVQALIHSYTTSSSMEQRGRISFAEAKKQPGLTITQSLIREPCSY